MAKMATKMVPLLSVLGKEMFGIRAFNADRRSISSNPSPMHSERCPRKLIIGIVVTDKVDHNSCRRTTFYEES